MEKKAELSNWRQHFIEGLNKLAQKGLPVNNIRGVGTMISFQVGEGKKRANSIICKKTF